MTTQLKKKLRAFNRKHKVVVAKLHRSKHESCNDPVAKDLGDNLQYATLMSRKALATLAKD